MPTLGKVLHGNLFERYSELLSKFDPEFLHECDEIHSDGPQSTKHLLLQSFRLTIEYLSLLNLACDHQVLSELFDKLKATPCL